MKEGTYYSEKEQKFCYIYNIEHNCECQKCGRVVKKPIALIWEDDEDELENIYGSECVKDLKVNLID